MAAIDWTKIYKKHKSRWIALRNDEKTVVSSSTTAKKALALAQKKGVRNPILTRVPHRLTAILG